MKGSRILCSAPTADAADVLGGSLQSAAVAVAAVAAAAGAADANAASFVVTGAALDAGPCADCAVGATAVADLAGLPFLRAG